MAEQQSILSEAASIELAKGILKLAEQIAQQKIEQQQKRWLTQGSYTDVHIVMLQSGNV